MESEFSQELQAQAYETLSSNDVKPMETLFSHVFSHEEPQRSQAFNILSCCKKNFPSLLFIKLFFLLGYGNCLNTRVNAANVLRFLQVRDLWHTLTSHAKSSLKSHFLDYLRQEDFLPSIKIVCGIVADILCEIYRAKDQWAELLDFLVKSVKSGNEKFQESAFLVFSHLPTDCRVLICGALTSRIESLHAAFLNALASMNVDVQVAAFRAVVSLIHLFSGTSEHDGFRDLLQAMMVGVFNLLSRSQEDYAQKVIKDLMMLVTEESHIFKPYVNNLVLEMVKIADNQLLKVETKYFAAKFLVTLMEARALAAKMVDLPNLSVVRLFSISIKMLLCIKDDTAWYQMECGEGENAGKTYIYNFGIQFLNRISITFGEKRIVSIAFRLLPIYMDAQEWQKRYAGITMLAEISKECSDEMVMTGDYMEQAVTNIMRSFRDTHPRVCWAAFNFMQLPTDFVQVAQILHHPRIVPALAAALDKNQNPRVKEQVASALLFFMKNIPPDYLTMYMDLDDIMRKLLVLLRVIDKTEKGRSIALCTFNIFAQRCREVAIKHYAGYIPILLEACSDKNPETKQEATRGIRVCAEFGGTEFKPFIKSAISKLSAVLRYPNRSYSEDVKAFDIAVSALGKICEFHRNNIDAAKLLPTWLSLLPLKDDLTEAKIAHKQLCSMVEKYDRELLGPNNQCLPKIIAVFLEVGRQGNELATVETIRRMTDLIKFICQSLPHAALNAILSALNAEQQELLKSVVFP